MPKHRLSRTPVAAWMLGLTLPAAAAACGSRSPGPVAHIKSDRVKELSGMAPARGEGEFWCLNDSGNPAEIYRVRTDGELLQVVTLSGAPNVDWEAMAKDDQDRLLIVDCGDNLRRRPEYPIYRIPEPAADQASATPEAVLRYRYEDGVSRDCESFFLLAGRMYVISKEPSPQEPPSIFRLDAQEGADRYAAKLVAKLPVQGLVTDAAYSQGRQELAVLTYFGFLLFRVAAEADLGNEPVDRQWGVFGQAEALLYAGDDLLLTNETGSIWRFSLAPSESPPPVP